jgi:hypothetical protein
LHDYQWLGVNATHLLVANIQVGTAGKTTHHYMYTTPDLGAGKPYSRSEVSFAAGVQAVPCVHESYTTDAFWIRRDDDAHASVWAVRGGQLSSKQFAIQKSTGQVNGNATRRQCRRLQQHWSAAAERSLPRRPYRVGVKRRPYVGRAVGCQ